MAEVLAFNRWMKKLEMARGRSHIRLILAQKVYQATYCFSTDVISF
jgi:hypothetical protein